MKCNIADAVLKTQTIPDERNMEKARRKRWIRKKWKIFIVGFAVPDFYMI